MQTLGEECLLYVDRNFVHEESTQAFEALVTQGRPMLRPGNNVAFCDHYAPTRHRERGVAAIPDAEVREMIGELELNARRHGLTHYGMNHAQQGIMHVVGPELGLVLPGFDNVDVYPLLTHLLGLPTRGQDGDPGTLLPALEPGQPVAH